MTYEIKPVEDKEFPIVPTRSSKYAIILARFISSQLERGKVNCADIKTNPKAIQTSLRKQAKKLGMELEIVVNEDKEVFIKKI